MFTLPSEAAAKAFVGVMPSVIAGKTGRHTFPQWDQVLMHEGAHHPALNPYTLPENRGLRTSYAEGMCRESLDILNRTVMIATHPQHDDATIADTIHNIDQAARVALENAALDDIELRSVAPVDLQKFDSAADLTLWPFETHERCAQGKHGAQDLPLVECGVAEQEPVLGRRRMVVDRHALHVEPFLYGSRRPRRRR